MSNRIVITAIVLQLIWGAVLFSAGFIIAYVLHHFIAKFW